MKHSILLVYIATFITFFLTSCNDSNSETTKEEQVYYNPAIASYTEAIKESPNDATLYYKRSIALANMDIDELALKDLDKATTLDPKNDTYWASKGELLNYLNKYEQAVIAYSKACELTNESSSEKHNNYKYFQYQLAIGKSLLLDNKIEQAQNIVDKVLQQTPNYPDAYYLLAQISAARKDTANAEKYLIKSLNYDPTFYEASLLLGEYYAEQNKAIAVRQYLYTYTLDSNETYPLFQIGYFYESQKDTGNALKAYKRVIEIDKDYTDAYIQLGKLFIALDSIEKANRNLKLAVATEPSNPKAHYWLGKSYQLLHKNDSAKFYYANALGLNPKYEEANNALNNMKIK
jgi:tetratricopeptide (TPR) repeat protein